MTMATPILSAPPLAPSSAHRGLVEVLDQETRGLEEFIAVLERQRTAVSHSDRATLDESVGDLDRLLLRLGKLREQRQAMVEQLGGMAGENLGTWLAGLGARAPRELHEAHRALRQVAEAASQASRINHVVIRRVLESERTFLQSLFRDGPAVGYPGSSVTPPAGVLLDRQG